MRITCPACAFVLKEGSEHFRCVQCASVYSKQFVRRMRKQEFSSLIDRHFGETVEITEDEVSVAVEVARSQPLEELLPDATIEEVGKPLSHVADTIPDMITPSRKDRIEVNRPR